MTERLDPNEETPPEPHPLANELVEDEEHLPEASTREVVEQVEQETSEEKLLEPTSKPYQRELVGAWAVFGGWAALVIIISIVVAVARGGFDWISGGVLLAIPLALFFLFPIWMGVRTKSNQDEDVRRTARHRDEQDDQKPGSGRSSGY